MIEIPLRCYEERAHRGTKLVCEANGRSLVFIKPAGAIAEKIVVDGCVVRNLRACDYLVIDWRGRKHFVELKGKDVDYALRQLDATIPKFLEKSDERIWCFVISAGTPPNISTSWQNAKLRFTRRWKNAELRIKTHACVHQLV